MTPDTGNASSAACLVHDAAKILSDGVGEAFDRARYLDVAVRLESVLPGGSTRSQILDASPYVMERSGRLRTIVEMIEFEPGDDCSRCHLATLLLRALIWKPAKPEVTLKLIHLDSVPNRNRRSIVAERLSESRRSRHPCSGNCQGLLEQDS